MGIPFIFKHPNQQHKNKYVSKKLIGLFKVAERQREKVSIVEIEITPIVLSYNFEEGKYTPLKIVHVNDSYPNNLRYLISREDNQTRSYTNYKSKIVKNPSGKYQLSFEGRDILMRKKNKGN